jgi:hypothetical protein
MKRTLLRLVLGISAVGAFVGCSSTEKSDSSTSKAAFKIESNTCSIDDATYASSVNGFINALFVDSLGRLFRGGSDLDSVGAGTWKLFYFDSNSWVESDSVQVYNDHLVGMVEANDGSLVSVGKVMSAGASHEYSWVVRKSTDAGATWGAIESIAGDQVKQIIKTSTGALLAGGNRYGAVVVGSHSQGYSEATVRRSLDNGDSWVNLNVVSVGASQSESFVKLIEDSNGNLYYVAEAGQYQSYKTIVRKSTDGGATWTTVSTIQDSVPHALAADTSGQIFLADWDWVNQAGWTIRKSSDGGATWSIIDQPQNISNGTPNLMEISPSGQIVVIGNYMPTLVPDVVSKLLVRISDDGGQTWTNIDSYDAGAGLALAPNALTFMGSSFVVGGNVSTTLANYPPFIRKYDCP